jgi:hypothetical protein
MATVDVVHLVTVSASHASAPVKSQTVDRRARAVANVRIAANDPLDRLVPRY